MTKLTVRKKGGPGSGHRGHGGRPGKRGGSAPKASTVGISGRRTVNEEFVEFELDKFMHDSVNEEQYEQIAVHLIEHNVPVEHINGITFRTDPPPNRYKGITSFVHEKSGSKALGSYVTTTRDIHIHPHNLKTSNVLMHELGHHVTISSASGLRSNIVPVIQVVKSLGFYGKGKLTRKQESKLSELGLRKYSLVNYKEFAADVYKVFRLGDSTTKSKLSKFLGSMELSWLEEDSKELIHDLY